MSAYSTALFLHVVSGSTLFMGLALEWVGLGALSRAASLERSRVCLNLLAAAGRMGRLSMLAFIASGGYLAASTWGAIPWVIVAVGAVAPFPLLAWVLIRPRVAAIRRAIAEGVLPTESLPTALRGLWVALNFRLGLALGLVFLMTAKPGYGIAWTGIGLGSVIGLTASLVSVRRISPQRIAVAEGRLEPRGSVIVGMVTLNQDKIVRPRSRSRVFA